jgi:hypothetical protein
LCIAQILPDVTKGGAGRDSMSDWKWYTGLSLAVMCMLTFYGAILWLMLK